MKLKQTDFKIISCLRQDARMRLTDMSKETRIPVSTIFDRMKTLEGDVIKRNAALVSFERLGYHARAVITLKVNKKHREQLYALLGKSESVNNLYRINNGWDYLAEVVFRGVKEVEDFVEQLEGKVNLKEVKVFYVIDEVKREDFLKGSEKGWLIERMRR